MYINNKYLFVLRLDLSQTKPEQGEICFQLFFKRAMLRLAELKE